MTLPAIHDYQLLQNTDGTFDVQYPSGNKNSSTLLVINLTAYNSSPPQATNLPVGQAVSFNLSQFLLGTDAAIATLAIQTVSGNNAASSGWSVSGGSIVNAAGGAVGSGVLQVIVTDPTNGYTVSFPVLSWSIVQSTNATSPKFNYGHYAWPGAAGWVQRGSSSASTLSAITGSAGQNGTAGWKGAKLSLYPAMMVGDTAGTYTSGFAYVDAIVAGLSGLSPPQHLILQGETLSYSAGAPDTSDYPQYMISSGVVETGAAGATAGSSVAWWTSAGMADIIAIWTAYGARYDKNPYVEMICPLEESTNPGAGFDWSGSAAITQLQNMVAALSPAWPNTLIRILINFTGVVDSSLTAFYDFCKGYPNVCIGGPDPEIPNAGYTYPLTSSNYPADYRTIQGNYVFRGNQNLSSGVFGVTNAEDFRPNIIWVGEVQDLGLLSPPTYEGALINSPALVCQYQTTVMQARYMCWNVGSGNVQLTANINSFIASQANVLGNGLVTTGTPTWPTTAPAYDYYISPGGSDSNAGTLASPWSITAFNSKQSVYAGKSIGVIGDVGGVQTPLQTGSEGSLYSMLVAENGGTPGCALQVNGGTSGSPTYVASCTSLGVYEAGWAIIDASNPSGGGLAGGSGGGPNGIIMGQVFYETTAAQYRVANSGYVTLDGLVVRNGNYAGIQFGDIQSGALSGVIIQNCQVYNITCSTSSENPGGIFLGNTIGVQVLNCLIYNCQNSGGSYPTWGTGGITTYKAIGLIVTGCTIYGCGYAIQNKDANQWGTYSYNYFDCGTLGSATGLEYVNAIKSCEPGNGETLTLHHNIIVGDGYYGYGADGTKISGNASFYNNTFYTPPAVTAGAYCAWFDTTTGAGPFEWYNNVVYYNAYGVNQGAASGCLSWTPTSGLVAANVNYNYYGTGMNFGNGSSANQTLAQWQAAGYDVNSISGASPFSSTPAFNNPASFAITGAATTAGKGGAACGALDGSGTVGWN
jgi:hypothetical protein